MSSVAVTTIRCSPGSARVTVAAQDTTGDGGDDRVKLASTGVSLLSRTIIDSIGCGSAPPAPTADPRTGTCAPTGSSSPGCGWLIFTLTIGAT